MSTDVSSSRDPRTRGGARRSAPPRRRAVALAALILSLAGLVAAGWAMVAPSGADPRPQTATASEPERTANEVTGALGDYFFVVVSAWTIVHSIDSRCRE